MTTSYIYTLASFDDKEIFIQPQPLLQFRDESENVELSYITDKYFSTVEKKNSIFKVSLLRFKIDQALELNNHNTKHYRYITQVKNFILARSKILEEKNFSDEYLKSIGFEKVVNFDYIVDPDNKQQTFNGYKIGFSYHEKFNSYYLDCPHIVFYK